MAGAEIAGAMRTSCPLQVPSRRNRPADGLGPFADGTQATSGPECGGAVTEVPLGTGAPSADRVDRRLNRLLNAGAADVRRGMGNGLAGVHFDLVSRDARLDTLCQLFRHAGDPPCGFPAPPSGAVRRRPGDR
ncbi:hypothetical protein AB0N16_02480 [Streptomyces sp. NPDC051105]|uniref:hypothetical protein n=1 Tax=Streptomyces sp. NPDC051105 TaxID=3154843 RepID=UPI00344932D1